MISRKSLCIVLLALTLPVWIFPYLLWTIGEFAYVMWFEVSDDRS